jgi:hypothetical protein
MLNIANCSEVITGQNEVKEVIWLKKRFLGNSQIAHIYII